MKGKILKIVLIIFILFTGFSFYMSPSLVGLIKGGKEVPDNIVEKLEFENTRNLDFLIEYQTFTENPDFIKLKTDFKLDTIVQNATSDFEKVLKIQSWVNSRWKHDGNNAPEKNDAYFILKQAQKGERFRCTEYSLVASECLKSLGFKVRSIGLMTKDIDEVNSGGGHAVNEVFIPDLNKWIFIDPQYDIMVMANGIPLNAVELQKAIANNESIEIINPNKVISKEEYVHWIGPYLFYFYTSLNKGKVSVWDRIVGNKKQLTLVPKGKKEPKYFQRIFRLNTMYFTNSVRDFYQTDQPKDTISPTNQQETNLPETNPYLTECKALTSFYGPSRITRNIIQDSQGNIWFATWEGIIRYDGVSFTNITSTVTMSRFFSVLEDSKGNFWFVSVGSGVYYYDGKYFKNFTTKEGLANDRVTSIYEDKTGDIWFGTEGGLSKYNGNSFTNYTTKDGLTNNDVNVIIEDKTGKFWFGTRGETCFFDGKTFTKFTNNEDVSFTNVRSIIEDKKGNIWLGGNDGLWRYDGNSFTQFTDKFVGYIYEDKKGNIWTSSESANKQGWALSRYDENTLANKKATVSEIKSEDGMYFGILEDTNGSIWLGTLNGVYRYDGNTFNDFKDPKPKE